MKKIEYQIKNIMLLISMFAVFFALTGCGKKGESTTGENIATESDASATDATQTASTEMPEPEKDILELSADEYYVDYPISLDKNDVEHSGKQVYVKIPPHLNFYPNGKNVVHGTNLEAYNTINYFITNLSMDTENVVSTAWVSYEIVNDYSFINYCIEGEVSGFNYEVGEPEEWDNGITAYKVDMVYDGGDKTTFYALYYPLDEVNTILVYIDGFIGTLYAYGDGELPDEHEEILNFYRTEKKPFIVVDPEEVEVIVSDNIDDSSYEVNEESNQASNEKPITETVTSSESSVETSHVDSGVDETYTPSDYTTPSASEGTQSTCSHAYGYGEINCMLCGEPHTHDWKIVVQTNTGVEITPDEDFCCHSGWYFDTYEELRAHMDIPNVHGMVYLNDGSNGVTSVSPDYTGDVDFYACCHGWANCAGDGEGERIEYEITQEVQFCKLCGVRGEATDIGERVIISHTYDD
ncbi:MAG: hypothetical protein J6J16_09185 [Lachnospiraceae bacterium]|nr:hypothetical protein [Lachnospiraceae bacterium]